MKNPYQDCPDELWNKGYVPWDHEKRLTRQERELSSDGFLKEVVLAFLTLLGIVLAGLAVFATLVYLAMRAIK